jgi:hypothetical protein
MERTKRERADARSSFSYGIGVCMKRKIAVAACLTAASFAWLSSAADHIDSPAAAADPAADLTDLFAWTSEDASKVNLVLNWHHMAPASAEFSNAVAYVIHVNSSAGYGRRRPRRK